MHLLVQLRKKERLGYIAVSAERGQLSWSL